MGKVVLVACTNVGRAIIEEIYSNENIKAEIVGVVNLNATVALGKANYDSYLDLGAKYAEGRLECKGKAPLNIHYCQNVNDTETLAFIKQCDPDIVIQSGWSQKFREELLNIPKYGCIGEHPAPLPRGRGAACVNWAILTGETNWGDSFFHMVDKYDAGEVYAQNYFDIIEDDNVYTVYEKVASVASKAVRENIDKWCSGEFESIKLDESTATYYGKRCPADGEIKTFDMPVAKAHDFIRAQTFPYPGAYIMKELSDGKTHKIILVSSKIKHDMHVDYEPGEFFKLDKESSGVFVTCAAGDVLEILRVKVDDNPTSWAGEIL